MSVRDRSMALNNAQQFVAAPSPPGKQAMVALVLLSTVLAVGAIKFSLVVFAVVFMAMVVVAGCSVLGARPFALFALVFSVPFFVAHHFVYRPNVGAGDGLVVYLTDLWVLWLMIDAVVRSQKGTSKSLQKFAGFLVPVILLLT